MNRSEVLLGLGLCCLLNGKRAVSICSSRYTGTLYIVGQSFGENASETKGGFRETHLAEYAS